MMMRRYVALYEIVECDVMQIRMIASLESLRDDQIALRLVSTSDLSQRIVMAYVVMGQTRTCVDVLGKFIANEYEKVAVRNRAPAQLSLIVHRTFERFVCVVRD